MREKRIDHSVVVLVDLIKSRYVSRTRSTSWMQNKFSGWILKIHEPLVLFKIEFRISLYWIRQQSDHRQRWRTLLSDESSFVQSGFLPCEQIEFRFHQPCCRIPAKPMPLMLTLTQLLSFRHDLLKCATEQVQVCNYVYSRGLICVLVNKQSSRFCP